jgi:hypothetical protein
MGPATLALVAILSMVAQKNAITLGPVIFVLHVVPVPTDCGMVRRVDPNFKSAMPVVTPDPKLALPIKVVAVPSCDPQRR